MTASRARCSRVRLRRIPEDTERGKCKSSRRLPGRKEKSGQGRPEHLLSRGEKCGLKQQCRNGTCCARGGAILAVAGAGTDPPK